MAETPAKKNGSKKKMAIAGGVAAGIIVIVLIVTNSPREGNKKIIEDLRAEQPVYYTPSAQKVKDQHLGQTVYVALGEFSVPHGDMISDNSDPGCGFDEETQLQKNLKAGLEALSKTEKHLSWLKEFSGMVSQSAANKLQPVVAATGGYISQTIVPPQERRARCGELTIFVPEGSQIKWIEPLAGDNMPALRPCPAASRYFCEIKYSRFTYKSEKNVVTGLFKHWSHNTQRMARLQVYFVPSESWVQAHPLSSASGAAL